MILILIFSIEQNYIENYLPQFLIMGILILLCVFLVIIFPVLIQSISNHGNNFANESAPLFLTPLIKSGRIKEAQRLSQIKSLPNSPKFLSYSGFLTVN